MKNYTLLFLACFASMIFFSHTCSASGESYLIEQYPKSKWLNHGAMVFYDKPNNIVTIQKSRMVNTPWGGAVLEVGATDISKDYYLKFNVIDLKGLYAVAIHYGGPDKYETQRIKIQEDTTIMGRQEYNVSEALRMEGLSGQPEIAIQFLLVDPDGQPGAGMVRLKDLSFGPHK